MRYCHSLCACLLAMFTVGFVNAYGMTHYVTCSCNTPIGGSCTCPSNGALSGETQVMNQGGWTTTQYQLTCNGNGGDNNMVYSYGMALQPSGVTCTVLADTTFANNQADFSCTNWNFSAANIQIGSVTCKYHPPIAGERRN